MKVVLVITSVVLFALATVFEATGAFALDTVVGFVAAGLTAFAASFVTPPNL